jgi:hypothetical protein
MPEQQSFAVTMFSTAANAKNMPMLRQKNE